MALSTKSKFYYGYEIETGSKFFDFDEGSGEISIEITPQIYSATDLATELQTQLNANGTKTYTVTFDRASRKYTIAADSGTYDILISSGTNASSGIYSILGFTGSVNLTGSISYTSDSVTGSQYKPQFFLQNYIANGFWESLTDASVNVATNGEVEVVSFGTTSFAQFEILFITDIVPQDGHVIGNDPSGVQNARDFLDFCIKKGNIEFMPDQNSPSDFIKMYLESTSDSRQGTGYKLIEETSKGLPGYYRTGNLKWRVLG